MALSPTLTGQRRVHDDFERHYTEKMWALVPAIYRHEDGTADKPGQLRALIEILAQQAAIERRNIDRVVADSRIEEADDWAISYIADLFGTRLVNPLNRAARRSDVGHTLRYRRRAGTVRLFELLADDIADWDAVADEAFQHLFRFPHAYDREFPMGNVTRTPMGGFPDMRRLRIGDVIDGPFEDMAYRPDFRRGRGTRGRYNIHKVNLYCYRKYAYALEGVDPYRIDDTHYTIDPSGRGHVPLFQQGGFDGRDECAKPGERDVRMPITCRRLNDVRYILPEDRRNGGAGWEVMVDRAFESQADFLAAAIAGGAGDLDDLLIASLDHESLKAQLLDTDDDSPHAISVSMPDRLEPYQIMGAGLSRWADAVNVQGRVQLLIDPATGMMQQVNDAVTADDADGDHIPPRIGLVHYGIMSPVGAGGHGRRERLPDNPGTPAVDPLTLSAAGNYPVDWTNLSGGLQVETSATHIVTATSNTVTAGGDMHIWALDEKRPYMRFEPRNNERMIRIEPDGSLAEAPDLTINGLWIGMQLAAVTAEICELRISGRWARVVLSDLTLDPGGMKLAPRAGDSGPVPERPIPHVRLVIDGQIEELVIDRCILGSVHQELPADAPPGDDDGAGFAGCIILCDSIIHGYGSEPAISAYQSDITMDRCTVINDVDIGRGEISNSIITGALFVQDVQGSCLRFSAISAGGRAPAPYESVVLDGGFPAGSFESLRFGDAGYAALTPACPDDVATGGENGTEMGVFNRALLPIKHADLLSKIAEFAPIQAPVQLIMKT